MDTNKFIHEVFQRPPIWDRRQKHYSNRPVVDRCWRETSEAMGVDDITLRKKWKYLRDQFSVESGRIKVAADMGSEPYEPTWIYYKSLSFLTDVIKPRQLTNKSVKKAFSDWDDIVYDNNDDPLGMPDVTQDDSQDKSTLPEVSRKRMRSVGNTINDDQASKFEQHKQADDSEEDLFFFRSLLSHVKKIPDRKKLVFRSRMLELVHQFVYASSSNTVPVDTLRMVGTNVSYEDALVKVETDEHFSD